MTARLLTQAGQTSVSSGSTRLHLGQCFRLESNLLCFWPLALGERRDLPRYGVGFADRRLGKPHQRDRLFIRADLYVAVSYLDLRVRLADRSQRDVVQQVRLFAAVRREHIDPMVVDHEPLFAESASRVDVGGEDKGPLQRLNVNLFRVAVTRLVPVAIRSMDGLDRCP